MHRCLRLDEHPVRRAALCTLMVSMKNFEVDTLLSQHLNIGVFQSFSEENVRKIASKVIMMMVMVIMTLMMMTMVMVMMAMVM